MDSEGFTSFYRRMTGRGEVDDPYRRNVSQQRQANEDMAGKIVDRKAELSWRDDSGELTV